MGEPDGETEKDPAQTTGADSTGGGGMGSCEGQCGEILEGCAYEPFWPHELPPGGMLAHRLRGRQVDAERRCAVAFVRVAPGILLSMAPTYWPARILVDVEQHHSAPAQLRKSAGSCSFTLSQRIRTRQCLKLMRGSPIMQPSMPINNVPVERIESENLILRPWGPGDRDAMAEVLSDPRVMEFVESPLLTREQAAALAQKIEQALGSPAFSSWTCELKETGDLVGFIGLMAPYFPMPAGPCVELSARIAVKYWGTGFAFEGSMRVLDFGFRRILLSEIVAFTAVRNVKAQRFAEKLGFVRDPSGDFDHPKHPEGHDLRSHVFYRMRPSDLRAQ